MQQPQLGAASRTDLTKGHDRSALELFRATNQDQEIGRICKDSLTTSMVTSQWSKKPQIMNTGTEKSIKKAFRTKVT